jgi:hypothetical protein
MRAFAAMLMSASNRFKMFVLGFAASVVGLLLTGSHYPSWVRFFGGFGLAPSGQFWVVASVLYPMLAAPRRLKQWWTRQAKRVREWKQTRQPRKAPPDLLAVSNPENPCPRKPPGRFIP